MRTYLIKSYQLQSLTIKVLSEKTHIPSSFIVICNRLIGNLDVGLFHEGGMQALPLQIHVDKLPIFKVYLDPGEGDSRLIQADIWRGFNMKRFEVLVGRQIQQRGDILEVILDHEIMLVDSIWYLHALCQRPGTVRAEGLIFWTVSKGHNRDSGNCLSDWTFE